MPAAMPAAHLQAVHQLLLALEWVPLGVQPALGQLLLQPRGTRAKLSSTAAQGKRACPLSFGCIARAGAKGLCRLTPPKPGADGNIGNSNACASRGSTRAGTALAGKLPAGQPVR